MFTQTLSESDEIVLLSDSTSSKPPEFIVHKDESKDIKDPETIEEAMASKYWPRWLAAIHEEDGSLKAKEVYDEIENLPPGRKAIGSRFVFRVKRDENGHVVRFKVRLVAQGYTQVPGQDFNHTFAPVARWDSIRFLLSVAAIQDLEVRHLDIKTAYLNGVLDEEIYLRKPKIFGGGFWRLKKGLYGLKQSGRQWYLTMNTMYEEIGFKRCESDWSVHVRRKDTDLAMTATSVDDILLVTNSKTESDTVTADIDKRFEVTDNGEVKWLLGCRIRRWRDRRLLLIDQEQFVDQILHQFGHEDANPAYTPCNPKFILHSSMCPKTDEEREAVQTKPYPALVGKLLYLATCTRPDISYAVRELSRFMGNYGEQHWNAAKHLLRYLKATKHYGITYGNVDNPYPIFRSFTDSDWAMGEKRRSITGYVTEMGGGPISWASKQQAVVALSSAEAEYIALGFTSRQVIWLRSLSYELGYAQPGASPINCDNKAAIQSSQDPKSHSLMKHIDIRYHFVRRAVNLRLIDVSHIPGIYNVSDIMTKGLDRPTHTKWVTMLHLDPGSGGVLVILMREPGATVASV